MRAVSNGPGETVSDAVTGIKLLAQGKTINYEARQVLYLRTQRQHPVGQLPASADQGRQIRQSRSLRHDRISSACS